MQNSYNSTHWLHSIQRERERDLFSLDFHCCCIDVCYITHTHTQEHSLCSARSIVFRMGIALTFSSFFSSLAFFICIHVFFSRCCCHVWASKCINKSIFCVNTKYCVSCVFFVCFIQFSFFVVSCVIFYLAVATAAAAAVVVVAFFVASFTYIQSVLLFFLFVSLCVNLQIYFF